MCVLFESFAEIDFCAHFMACAPICDYMRRFTKRCMCKSVFIWYTFCFFDSIYNIIFSCVIWRDASVHAIQSYTICLRSPSDCAN